VTTEASMHIVVVTGLSGAGKTTALNALSDAGYYCVDNLPPALATATARVCEAGGIEWVALGMDVRVGAFLDSAGEAIEQLAARRGRLTVLYLDADEEALVRRFGETRRPHPLLSAGTEAPPGSGSVAEGVRLERQRLEPIRSLATLVVDTSHMSVHELRRQVLARFALRGGVPPTMHTRVMSFGFKYGLPLDADVVFDVRFLDNPFFVPELRELPGTAKAVRQFVMGLPAAGELLDRLQQLLEFALPHYQQEGKSYLTVAVGCTGGRHRSVVVAAELARRLSEVTTERVAIVHRDVARGAMMTRVSFGSPTSQTASSGQLAPEADHDGEGRS